jgi:hypothetical protein
LFAFFSPLRWRALSQVYSTALPGPVSGAVAGSWTIPDGTAGGNYRAKVSYPQHKYADPPSYLDTSLCDLLLIFSFELTSLPSAERVFNIRQFSTRTRIGFSNFLLYYWLMRLCSPHEDAARVREEGLRPR